MRVIRHTKEETLIELSRHEGTLLRDLFSQYPIASLDRRQLTQTGDPERFAEETELLREALTEHAQENQKRLQTWLDAEGALSLKESACYLRVSHDEINWILQVLNDLRIGSWEQLGCPSQIHLSLDAIAPEEVLTYWSMELTGLLQTLLLAPPRDASP